MTRETRRPRSQSKSRPMLLINKREQGSELTCVQVLILTACNQINRTMSPVYSWTLMRSNKMECAVMCSPGQISVRHQKKRNHQSTVVTLTYSYKLALPVCLFTVTLAVGFAQTKKNA